METAYIIMPYAKEYDRVYRNLIKPAVEECGMECVRTDMNAQGGYVLSRVIQSLAESAIVIADISSLKWNVAYELGIRHVFSRKGTIIMCDSVTDLPFDINGYNILQYEKNWLVQDLDETIISKIVSHIKSMLQDVAPTDSPVHTLYKELPDSVTQLLGDAAAEAQYQIQTLSDKIEKLNAENTNLTAENERLQKRLEDLGLDDAVNQQDDIEQQFLDAIANSQYNSDEAVATLREYLEDGKKEEFVRFLSKVLSVGYLDETDCRNIYILCHRLGNPTVTTTFLKKAVVFYPENEELQGFLADSYSDDYRTRDKALSMANTMIGLSKRNGNYELTQKFRSERMLMSFFNVYLSLKLYKDIIEIGFKLIEQSQRHSSLIRRNILKGYTETEQYDQGIALANQLIAEDPTSALNHYQFYRLLREKEEYYKAYEELEFCIACDPDDTDYYLCIAGFICDDHIARTISGKTENISKEEIESIAAPFILHGMQLDQNFTDSAVQFFRRNKFTKTLSALVSDDKDIEEGLNYTALNYCLNIDLSSSIS